MRIFLVTLLAALVAGVADVDAQVALRGSVKDADTRSPLLGVSVRVAGSSIAATTDRNGEYSLAVPAGRYVFAYNLYGYQGHELELDVVEEATLPDVLIRRTSLDEGQSLSLNEVIVSTDDLESAGGSQAVAGLLQSTQDAFSNAVSYTFSPARFKVRGYDAEYTLLYMNGIPVNDPESGFAGWSSWGGLNDVTRNRESTNGLAPTEFSFGGVGGQPTSTQGPRSSAGERGCPTHPPTGRTPTGQCLPTPPG